MSTSNNSFPMATAVPMAPPTSFTTSVKNHGSFKVSSSYQSQNCQHSEQPSSDSLIIDRDITPITDHQMQRLQEQGFTRGLGMSLNDMRQIFALRFWIIDNSGSMQKTDGHRIVATTKRNEVKQVACSRWEEIVECVEYHIRMAALIEAPTKFRLLNNPGANVGPQQFSIAAGENGNNSTQQEAQDAVSIIRRARPGGCTPLTAHVLEIQQEVSRMAHALNRAGKKVVIVIATDGLPTDERGYGGPAHNQEFVDALRLLEGLPVWVVIRLCTDEDDIVDFYNELDEQLELSLEVLDDFAGEAKEVTDENPWLNYALPLHRLREMGYHDRVFDMLDERPLTKSEVRDFCALLFGEQDFDGVPDPSLDWNGFADAISLLLRKEMPQYDPIKKRVHSWINTKKLNQIHGDASCAIM